jgi:hypothetical protein
MKKIIVLGTLILLTVLADADQYVNGYTKNNGTYVEGYNRSSPNSTRIDNYSSKGNSNPYTGEKGNNDPYKSNSQNSNFSSTGNKKYGY